MQLGMAGATRKANFAAPVRGAYTGVGAARTANRPAAELGNWSTTYTNSYEVLPLCCSGAVYCYAVHDAQLKCQLRFGLPSFGRLAPMYDQL